VPGSIAPFDAEVMTVNVAPRALGARHTTPPPVLRPAAGGIAYVLSLFTAALMVVASASGLWTKGLYHESAWAAGALRGGDLVTLVLAVPVLVISAWWARRGSARAVLVWAAMLVYNVYNYTYMVFGTTFNRMFLAHIAILAASIWALVYVFGGLDVDSVAAGFSPRTPARPVAALFGLVTAVLGGMWGMAILRQAFTGHLPADPAGPAGLHMVYATDLTIFVPTLGVAAVLLWRRTNWGYVLGTVMATTSAAYLLNLAAAAYFQSRAHVAGIAAFSPLTAVLVLSFAAAAAAMLTGARALRR
jgi:hypothetical protein